MALNEFEKKDYLEEMRKRVTFAFEESPVFDKYLQLLTLPAEEMQEVLRQLMQERSIDTAVGKQLDIIGDIVGQSRILIGADLIPFFGYAGAVNANSFGDKPNPSTGGYYWNYGDPLGGNIVLTDDIYRLFIRAKIMKNITRATPEDVITFIKFVFEVNLVQITVDEAAEALILVSEDIDNFELVLLKYFTEGKYRSYFIPKTLGVGYNFGTFPTNFFSFAGVPGANGYGNLIEINYDGQIDYDGQFTYSGEMGLEPGVGGIYASII